MSEGIGDLEIFATFIAMDVIQAMQAAITIGAANLLFAHRPEWFFTNPANTFTHAALQALEERAVVHLAELLKTKTLQLPDTIRRKFELVCHRNALSHPTTITWRRPEMQTFYDQRRHYLDLRPALIWDLQRSVNEGLVLAGKPVRVERTDIIPGMALELSSILRLSIKEIARSAIPDEPGLYQSLHSFRDRYFDFLVEHADGMPGARSQGESREGAASE